jgi:hypothetical protein
MRTRKCVEEAIMSNIPPVYLEIVQKVVISLIVAGIAVVVSRLAGKFLEKSIKDEAQMLTMRLLARKITYPYIFRLNTCNRSEVRYK